MKKRISNKNKVLEEAIQETELPIQLSRIVKAIIHTQPTKSVSKKIHSRGVVPAIKKGKDIKDDNDDEAIDLKT